MDICKFPFILFQSFHVLDKRYVVPLEMKNKLLDHLSPVLYVQSDCDTPLDRDRFVGNLMKFVPIDSYGACLQNKQLPLSYVFVK